MSELGYTPFIRFMSEVEYSMADTFFPFSEICPDLDILFPKFRPRLYQIFQKGTFTSQPNPEPEINLATPLFAGKDRLIPAAV